MAMVRSVSSTVEAGEECDDGNTGSGDGCDASCQYDTSACVAGSCGASKDACSVNADCCSNNCKGGTCKGN